MEILKQINNKMNKKIIFLIIGMFILVSMGSINAWFDDGTSTQNVDGCNEMNTTGAVYTLTTNITGISGDCFTIEAENIVFEMGNFNITGDDTGNGIAINEDIATIKNGEIYDFEYGISLGSNGNNITNMTLNSNVEAGLLFIFSNLNNIENVECSNSDDGFGIGIIISSNNNLFINITLNSNNNSGIYLTTLSNHNIIKNSIINSNGIDGVTFYQGSNNTLINNTISLNNNSGISLEFEENSSIINNSVTSNNEYGIFLSASSNNILINNNMTHNTYNLYFEGNSEGHYNNTIDFSNTIESSYKIYQNFSIRDAIFNMSTTPNLGAFYCFHCDNITISGFNLSQKNGQGIFFWNTSNSLIDNITANNLYRGIRGFSNNNNSIYNIISNNNIFGLGLYNSFYNRIINITTNLNEGLGGDQAGTTFFNSSHNYIENIASNYNTRTGILLTINSDNNTFINGNFSNNGWWGIDLAASDNNIFSDIEVIDNVIGVVFDASTGNLLSNFSVISNGGSGVRLSGDNNIIRDGNISGHTSDVQVSLNTINNTALNVTYDTENVGVGEELIRKWYYQAYVNDTNGNLLSNANITSYNPLRSIDFSILTNDSGWVEDKQGITEYINLDGTKNYYSEVYVNNDSYYEAGFYLNETTNNLNGLFTLSNEYGYYENKVTEQNFNVSLIGLTNALIYYSNNSVACSDINSCDGNINITLTPNNYSYVLDNFNLTNGIIRQLNPINITKIETDSTSKTYSISSLINEDIIIPIYNLIVPDGYTLTSVTISPKDKSQYSPAYTYDSITKRIQISAVNLSYSTSSNKIILGLTTQQQSDICSGFFDAGTSFTGFIIILIIVSIAGFVLFLLINNGDLEIDTTGMAIVIIIAGVIITLGMIIINSINKC